MPSKRGPRMLPAGRSNGRWPIPPCAIRPVVPRLVSITDAINLVAKNRCLSGVLKVQIEEVSAPESVEASLGDHPLQRLEITCIDRRAPRYEFDLRLPERMPAGRHALQIRVGRRQLPPIEVEVS